MSKLKAILLFALLTTVVFGLNAMAETRGGTFIPHTGSITLHQTEDTTSQVAVYAAFMSDSAGGDLPVATAISFSNVLVEGFQLVGPPAGGGDTRGTLEFFGYDRDGSLIFWSSDMHPNVGNGLNEDGTLGPGQTWTVLLREILTAAGFDPDKDFNGWACVVANFDGVLGTYNVTIFGLGFTQNFEWLPGAPWFGLPVRQVEDGGE